MMLPAATGRFWARDITMMIVIAAGCGAFSGYAGLLLSFHTGVPSGPAIILVAGVLYVAVAAVRPGRRAGAAGVAAAGIWKPE